MSSESEGHIVFPLNRDHGLVSMFPSYKLAHGFWKLKHDALEHPYMIAVVGRVIDPSTPVIDVNE